MPNPMTTRQKILERRQRLEDVESTTRQELQRLEKERAALNAELAAEDEAAAEAAALAAKSGLPVDVARTRIAKKSASKPKAAPKTDTSGELVKLIARGWATELKSIASEAAPTTSKEIQAMRRRAQRLCDAMRECEKTLEHGK